MTALAWWACAWVSPAIAGAIGVGIVLVVVGVGAVVAAVLGHRSYIRRAARTER